VPKPLDLNIQPASKEEIEEIDQRLGLFNETILSFVGKSEIPLSYVIRENGRMTAGISACLDWGFIVHIDLLFVDENHRHQGLGRFLIEKIESEAKKLGAGMAQTDTFDFQAKDFYLKQGYEVFGEIENSPRPGHKRFYLKKALV
jgi:GNAT superfamily N-acetyltransferase